MESRKHAAAVQAQLGAELDSARTRLASATEKLDQQQRSLEEEKRAAKSSEASLQVRSSADSAWV